MTPWRWFELLTELEKKALLGSNIFLCGWGNSVGSFNSAVLSRAVVFF